MTSENAPSTYGNVRTSYGKDGKMETTLKEDVMLLKGEERNGGKWKIGVVEHPIQGWDGDGVMREAQLRDGKTHIEKPLQLLYLLELTCDRPERRRGETLRADAREFQPRTAAADDLGRLIVRSELPVSWRIKIMYIKPVWLIVARSFTSHKQRASTREFCQMRDVNKIYKYVKNEPQDERKFPQGIRPSTRLWHPPDLLTSISNYVFLNNSGAFRDLKLFSLDGRNVWIQFSHIKEKKTTEGGQ